MEKAENNLSPSSLDKDNLFDIIKDSPNQLTEGLTLVEGVNITNNVKKIVLSGMGGSALVGKLINLYLTEKLPKGKNLPIIINRNYSLPRESFEEGALNIISSYSGNTEETLSVLEEAIENKLQILGMGSGGKLVEICQRENIPKIVLPCCIQPRVSIGYSFSALMALFENHNIISGIKEEIISSSQKLKNDFEKFRKLGESIAKDFNGNTPVIYASTKFKSIAMIWKIMLNENGKTPAFWNYFPELNHNEMVGFTKPQADFFFAMLRDTADDPRNLKRFDITSNIFENYGLASRIIDIPEGDLVYRIFGLLQIGCYASYYLALSYEIDPTPVEMVEKLKKMLAS